MKFYAESKNVTLIDRRHDNFAISANFGQKMTIWTPNSHFGHFASINELKCMKTNLVYVKMVADSKYDSPSA